MLNCTLSSSGDAVILGGCVPVCTCAHSHIWELPRNSMLAAYLVSGELGLQFSVKVECTVVSTGQLYFIYGFCFANYRFDHSSKLCVSSCKSPVNFRPVSAARSPTKTAVAAASPTEHHQLEQHVKSSGARGAECCESIPLA